MVNNQSYAEVFWKRLQEDMKLTDHGLIMLQMFDYFVVMSQYKDLNKSSITGCPVKALAKLCHSYSKSKGIDVDLNKYYKKIRSLNIDQKSSLTMNTEVILQATIVHKSSYKGKATPESIRKGVEFLGETLPLEVKEVLLRWVNDPDSVNLEEQLELVPIVIKS